MQRRPWVSATLRLVLIPCSSGQEFNVINKDKETWSYVVLIPCSSGQEFNGAFSENLEEVRDVLIPCSSGQEFNN